MPLPMRKKNETTVDFVNRMMGHSGMKREFPKQKQRVAVAYSQARRKGKQR